MPRYEYFCSFCRHSTERQKPVAQRDTAEVCPECGQLMARLITSAPGIAFRGSGWTQKGK